jgi:polyferredoxin
MSSRKERRQTASGRGWVRARKAVQSLSLLTFVVLFLWSRQDGWPGEVVNIPMRLDPLLVLSHALASRTLLAGSALALLTVASTIIAGRVWCGWICPLGTTLDLLAVNGLRKSAPVPAEGWRGVKYTLVALILAAACLRNQALLFFDPLSIFQRTLTVSVRPAANQIVTAFEAALYRNPAMAAPISTLDAWIRPTLLPVSPTFFRDTLLLAAFFAALVALDLVAARFWCRYLCPLGGLLGFLSKIAIFRRDLKQACKGCALCTALCPTGTISSSKGYASDPGECTVCLECLQACPRDLTTFKPQLSRAAWNTYDPNRRQALFAMGTALAATALYRTDALAARQAPNLLRPPGVPVTNEDPVAFTNCTRCGECLRVCPTSGLQPAVLDAGVEGLGSPVLMPRLGYCDYSCNACGQICPVEAIPRLGLADKRLQIIGQATIDENRCIAWSDHQPCIVCEEMCPLPKKAIELEVAQVWGPGATRVVLQLPHVLRDLCIGCGICEYQCPVSGSAAIRVYNAAADRQLQGGAILRVTRLES